MIHNTPRLILQVVFCIFVLFLISGCRVLSVNKFYTQDEYIRESPISGQWFGGFKYGRVWQVGVEEIECLDPNAPPGGISFGYFKIKEIAFLDITVSEQNIDDKVISTEWLFHVIPAHTLWKIEIVGPKVYLIPMNRKWIFRQIDKGHISLPHAEIVDGSGKKRLLFTASPGQWVAFLEENLQNEKLFDRRRSIEFTRHVERSKLIEKDKLTYAEGDQIPFSGFTIDYGNGEVRVAYIARYSKGKLEVETKYLKDQGMFLYTYYENGSVSKKEYYGLRGAKPIKSGKFIKREIYEDGAIKQTVTADDLKKRRLQVKE